MGFEPTNLFGIGASERRAHNVAFTVCNAPQTVDYELFGKWLYQNFRPFTARPVLAYAKKYGHLLLSGNLSPLLSFSDGKRSATVKSFATLSKYLGILWGSNTLIGISLAGTTKKEHRKVQCSRLGINMNAHFRALACPKIGF